jgi:[acyl-carrier-protein] S-malonyltransferase
MSNGDRPAFLFPGQLSEWVGMGRDFYDADSAGEARGLFDETSRRCGLDLARILFEGPESELHENLPAQAGVFLVSTLAARELARRGVRPSATAGYSLGNYAAMVAAGGISYEEALDVLIAVWRETERLGIRGAMGAVVGARADAVEGVCEALRGRNRPVWIGNVNASTQFVLTGSKDGVAEALAELTPRALSVLPLTMSWPIHSELMRPVAEAIAPRIAALLGTAFCFPTLWKQTFEAMVADGQRVFLEVGPGEMLSKMARWIDRNARCHAAGTLSAIEAVGGRVGAAS